MRRPILCFAAILLLAGCASASREEMLTSTVWIKSNTLGLDEMPTKLTYNTDSTFAYEYRNGECTMTGLWTLDEGGLITDRSSPSCITGRDAKNRRVPIVVTKGRFQYSEDLYVPESEPPEGEIIQTSLGNYDNFSLIITYPEKMRSGKEMHYTMDIQNTGTKTMILDSFMMKEAQADKVSGFVEDITTVTTVPLSGREIKPGKTYTTEFDATVQSVGETRVGFTLKYDLAGDDRVHYAERFMTTQLSR